jgi:protein tyrosine/serine phosphatase
MDLVAPTACYIHCVTGNNRSGVFIEVFLSLLGIKPEKTAEEYSLSDIVLRPTRDATVTRLLKSPVFAKRDGKTRAQRMVGVRPGITIAMLEMVEKEYGSAEGYVKKMAGLTNEEIAKVRRVLTVRSSPTSRKMAPSIWDSMRQFCEKAVECFYLDDGFTFMKYEGVDAWT